MTFDVVIVGSGLIGSSCAKYASKMVYKAAVIDPDSDYGGVGAWHDEGRITRMFDGNPAIWGEMAAESIRRYRDIEAESGIPFYTERGFLRISIGDDHKMEKSMIEIKNSGFQCGKLTASECSKMFPLMRFPENSVAYHQPNNSGFINPRKMVEAQLEIALNHGCVKIKGAVKSLRRIVQGAKYELRTENGDFITAEKVIIANGSLVNFIRGLTDNNLELDISLKSQTVAYFEVSDDDQADEYSNLPDCIPDFPHGALDSVYLLPPIYYPESRKHLLKAGHGSNFEENLTTEEDIYKWHENGGNPDAVKELEAFVKDFMPGLRYANVKSGSCVTTNVSVKSHSSAVLKNIFFCPDPG